MSTSHIAEHARHLGFKWIAEKPPQYLFVTEKEAIAMVEKQIYGYSAIKVATAFAEMFSRNQRLTKIAAELARTIVKERKQIAAMVN